MMAPNVRHGTTEDEEAWFEGWSFPPSRDGWVVAHTALRLAFEQMIDALQTLRNQALENNFTRKQAEALQKWVARILHDIKLHHDNEEVVLFPWIAERVQLPEKMTADHKTLMSKLNELNNKVHELQGKGDQEASALEEIQQLADETRLMMEEHLRDEETQGIKIVRENFKEDEYEEKTTEILGREVRAVAVVLLVWNHPTSVARKLRYNAKRRIELNLHTSLRVVGFSFLLAAGCARNWFLYALCIRCQNY